jgi:hypothetical protein
MNTGPRKLLGLRQEVGLALSSIRVGVKHTLYDNIVSRYELLGKVPSLLDQFSSGRHPERSRFSGGAKDLAPATTRRATSSPSRCLTGPTTFVHIVPPFRSKKCNREYLAFTLKVHFL